jgi:type VII secretion protein EccE
VPRGETRGVRLLGVPLWQLVSTETLLAGTAVAAAVDLRLLPVTATVAVAGLVVVLGRWRHRPVLSWLLVRLRYRRRQRRAAIGDGVDQRLAPLREILPGLDVSSVALREGQRLAVCFDGAGWSAAVALHREHDLLARPATAPRLPPGVLAGVMRVDDIPLAGLQVLVHTMAAPDARLPEGSPVTASYQQLDGRHVPAVRQTLVVLRMDAATGREAIEARGGGAEGARRAVKRSVSRLLELLESARVPARPLAEASWLTTLFDVAGTAEPPAGPGSWAAAAGGGPRTRETRRAWQVGPLTHLTWWVRSWPDVAAPLQGLVDLASQVPAASTTVSFTLYPAVAGSLRCRALLRTTARSTEAAEAAAAVLRERATAASVDLQRLDGEHGPGYVATLPLGGGSL